MEVWKFNGWTIMYQFKRSVDVYSPFPEIIFLMNKCVDARTFLCVGFLSSLNAVVFIFAQQTAWPQWFYCEEPNLCQWVSTGAGGVDFGRHARGKAGKGWGNSPTGVENEGGGGMDHMSTAPVPVDGLGVKLGPSRIPDGEIWSQIWQIFPLHYGWSVKMDAGSMDGQIDTLQIPFF